MAATHAHVADDPLEPGDRPTSLGEVGAVAAEALADQNAHGLAEPHHRQEGHHVEPDGQRRGARWRPRPAGRRVAMKTLKTSTSRNTWAPAGPPYFISRPNSSRSGSPAARPSANSLRYLRPQQEADGQQRRCPRAGHGRPAGPRDPPSRETRPGRRSAPAPRRRSRRYRRPRSPARSRSARGRKRSR